MLTETQKKELGELSVNDRRNALIGLFGYEGLPDAWSELEESRHKAPKDAALPSEEPKPEPRQQKPRELPPRKAAEKESD